MKTQQKRWSKAFDPTTRAYTLVGEARITNFHRSDYVPFDRIHDVVMSDLPQYTEYIEIAGEKMREADFDPVFCHQYLEDFYLEEWQYQDPFDGRFHDRGLASIHEILQKYTEQEYDVRVYWRNFRDYTARLWKALPDFCKGRQAYEEGWEQAVHKSSLSHDSDIFKNLEVPQDYDPNKPFPQYVIPADIDDDVKKE